MTFQNDLRIVLASDTHELHREVDMPDGSILLFAGDLSFMSRRRSAIADFNLWLGELPYRHVVLTLGNHDAFGVDPKVAKRLLSNATVLINEGIEIDGLRIWGSPNTPLSSGAFATPSAAERANVFARVPDDTDVLITHVPPLGILDGGTDEPGAGCPELLRAVLRVQPRLHVFGHLHSAHGIEEIDSTVFVNCSLLGPDGDIGHRPIVMRLGYESSHA